MGLNKDERLLVEGIKSLLQQDAKLGLSAHAEDHAEEKADPSFQYLHEQIDEMFLLRAAELTHSESVTAAFRKVHGYKYLEDWTFLPTMDKEMVSKAVPMAERRKALEFIPKIVEELRSEHHLWAERDSGFNPKLDEVRSVSRPEQKGEFKVHDKPINKKNVEKPKKGDGSPARTGMTQPPLPGDGHDNDDADPGDGEGN